jgi:hypothetical protein
MRERMKGDFETQTREAMVKLMKNLTHRDDIETMAIYIAQVFNFFIIGPMCSEKTAREMISRHVFESDKGIYHAIMRKEEFKPSELVAAIAMLFRNIAVLHLRKKGSVETDRFPLMMVETIKETERHVLEVFPGIKIRWEYFMLFFMKSYMSPWNTKRYSVNKTRANFGTRIDYITIP